MHDLKSPSAQYPQLTLLVGRKHKNAALRQLCKGRYRSSDQLSALSLRVDDHSRQSDHPRLFVDIDLSQRRILPAFNSFKLCHRHETIPVNWNGLSHWDPYDVILSRLLFLFCDVVCIFADDIGGLEAVRSLLQTWVSIGSASSLPRCIRPRVIIVKGVSHCESVTERLLHEDDFLLDILDYQNVPPLFSCFANVSVSCMQSSELSAEARYLQLGADIREELYKARQAREARRLMFSALDLDCLFMDALREFATDALSPFDFLQSSRKGNQLSGSFVSHLSAFFSEGLRLHVSYDNMASYVASAILMDAYPPSKHAFCPRALFRSLYRKPVYTALQHVYNTPSFAKSQCQMIEDDLVSLFEIMAASGESSSQLHRYNIGHNARSWKALKLEFTCTWCLRQCKQHPVPCGHLICDNCVQRYGEQLIGSDVEYFIKDCIACREPACLKVKIKPATAGVRVVSIDGGGVRGIIPLESLASIQAPLGQDLPLASLVDFMIGTSSGGISALALGICQNDVVGCKADFLQLARKVFHRKSNQPKVRRVFGTLLSDGAYEAKSTDDVFIGYFGPALRMSDTPKSRISGCKVAVTASTIDDGTPILITNYNSETPLGKGRGYGCVRTKPGNEPLVWQAGRATSAVPGLFPSVNISEIGNLQDGGTRPQNNNPIHLGLSEVRRLWPTTPEPDVVISLGTGSESIARSPKAMTFRNILMDGFISRGYRSLNSSYDGEETWRQIWNLLDEPTRTRYIRVNYPFPAGGPPAMNNTEAIEPLGRWVQKQLSQGIKQAAIMLLVSSFYFEVDIMPEFYSGGFHCRGSIRCRAPAHSVIKALKGLCPAPLYFFKESVNLGLCLSEDDICYKCRNYIRPVRFFARDLREDITLSLQCGESRKLLSSFPNTLQWFIDMQGLEHNFGQAHHDIPFRIHCDECNRKADRIGGAGEGRNKRKYVDI
ncbi:uncharacterized protein CIMG_08728 [Coccidioides immitis RS]|uniref:FabD/lysophospholipase-like protein n=1 Tax=Coccidioides immitis (strain RS) TaxID=246410 RepID=J3K630_COCIM|nr:uncharacterized protein CIMG_08728 [Coccidioides immitis RS]EAS29982.3 hypothetical protein CIMG_08728 [Coccidioides immitis RS]